MNEGFYQQNNKVLKFKVPEDVDKILFDHYIKQKENYCRLKKELPRGQFYMSINNVATDLHISKTSVQRLINLFIELKIIKIIYKAKGGKSKKGSIYEYVSITYGTVTGTVKASEIATLSDIDGTVKKSNDNAKDNKIAGTVKDTVKDTVKNTVTGTVKASEIATLSDIDGTVKNQVKNKVFGTINGTITGTVKASEIATLSDIDGTISGTVRVPPKKEYIKNKIKNKNIGQQVDPCFIDSLWSLYPIGKRKKKEAIPYIQKLIQELGIEAVTRCVKTYAEYVKLYRKEVGFNITCQNGDNFFREGYIEFLDDHKIKEVEDKIKEKQESESTNITNFDINEYIEI